jgi:endogenous inhibitor of DNA gyrase (YacG/DUF329 family)
MTKKPELKVLHGGGKPVKCPTCGKPAHGADRPFCSPRCRQLDLGRWLDGSYRIPSEEEPEEDELAALLAAASDGSSPEGET